MGIKVQELQQEEEGQAQEEEVPGQVQEGCCSGASSLSGAWPIPSSCLLGQIGPHLKQVHEIKEQIRGFHEQWEHLAQEAERAEKEREQISNWVRDLLDQRPDLRIEIWKMEGELDQLKEEKDSLEASGLCSGGLGVAYSISGLSKGVSAGPSAPKKKKKGKQKRHPGLPLEERQEYYKAYLSYLQY